MNAHDRDKAIALLRALAAEHDSEIREPCDHCLAALELLDTDTDARALLREFLAELPAAQTADEYFAHRQPGTK